MPKIICTRQNASEEISGVKFTLTDDGAVSEDISEEQAQAFLEIDGYEPFKAEPTNSQVNAAELEERARVKAQAAADAAAAAQELADKAAADAAEKATTDAAVDKPEVVEDPKAALLARAKAAGLDVKHNWGLPRLQQEVEGAEAKQAAGTTKT